MLDWSDDVGCAEPVGAGVEGAADDDAAGPVGVGVTVGVAVELPLPPDDGEAVELGELVEGGVLGELVWDGWDGGGIDDGVLLPGCCTA